MKPATSTKVLVIGESHRDLDGVLADLKKHFKQVECTVSEPDAQAAFEQRTSDVFVLAFRDLEKAQPYCRTLIGADHPIGPQRSVLLCRIEDAAAALEMCKRQYFDDYVAYWPESQDRSRLAMSVWLAGRAALALRGSEERNAQLLTHAKQLGELDRKVSHELDMGEKQAAATQESMLELEQKLAKANDEFCEHLVQTGANAAIEVKNAQALRQDLAQFKSRQLELARTARDLGVMPINSWAQQLRGKVEPSLAGPRSFAAKVRQVQPTLLVVSDDETARGLLTPALRFLGYDPMVAKGGSHILAQLSRARPNAILMDVVSSSADSVSLTRQLKAIPDIADIPIIILSGDARRETLIRSIQAGAADFIAKPFTRDVLRNKLDKLLRQSALH